MQENAIKICEMLDRPGVEIRDALEDLIREAKAQRERLTTDQRQAWNEWKIRNFQARPEDTKVLDVISSLEMRPIPEKHGACPICHEQGTTVVMNSVKGMADHVKNTHQVRWNQGRNEAMLAFGKAIGEGTFTEASVGRNLDEKDVMGTWCHCIHPRCEHQDRNGYGMANHFCNKHESDVLPDMGLWALIIAHLKENSQITIKEFFGEPEAWKSEKCRCLFDSKKAAKDHVNKKHEKHPEESVKVKVVAKWAKAMGKEPSAAEMERRRQEAEMGVRLDIPREEVVAYGRRWKAELAEEWKKGVIERQLSRAETKTIRQIGEFPKFIKDEMIPLWRQCTEASFEAQEGFYEMCVHRERGRMQELRHKTGELYGMKKALTQEQLDSRAVASQHAKQYFERMKWCKAIADMMAWRTGDIAAGEVERAAGVFERAGLEVIRARKFQSFMKYLGNLKQLVPSKDPRPEEQEEEDKERRATAIWPKMKRGQDQKAINKAREEKALTNIVNATLPDKRKEILTEEEKAERETREKKLMEESVVLGRVHENLTTEQLEAIARETWEAPSTSAQLWETVREIQLNCLLGTMPSDEQSDKKFLKRAEAIRNRGDWTLDKKHVYRRSVLQRDMPQWTANAAGLANHYAQI
jgi:hypothetical protein